MVIVPLAKKTRIKMKAFIPFIQIFIEKTGMPMPAKKRLFLVVLHVFTVFNSN
jgi:hypothetical protein